MALSVPPLGQVFSPWGPAGPPVWDVFVCSPYALILFSDDFSRRFIMISYVFWRGLVSLLCSNVSIGFITVSYVFHSFQVFSGVVSFSIALGRHVGQCWFHFGAAGSPWDAILALYWGPVGSLGLI